MLNVAELRVLLPEFVSQSTGLSLQEVKKLIKK